MPPRKYRRRGGKNPIDKAFAPPFNILNPHDSPAPLYDGKSIIIVSIDPGVKDCGVYVQKINLETKQGKSLYMARLHFDEKDGPYVSSIKKFDDLEKRIKIFSKSHYIVIEQQMVISTTNTRMGQHLQSYFCTSLRNKGNLPIVIEFSSKAKTRVLECPPEKMKKTRLYKNWCAEEAIRILQGRDNDKEERYIRYLETSKKKDDVGDAVCQSKAFFLIIVSGIYPYPKPKLKD
jgi:hypothetical protein